MSTCTNCKYRNVCGDEERFSPCKGFAQKSEPYAMAIYGDGKYEYDGYFLVVLDWFDEFDHPTGKRKSLYVKAANKSMVRNFINHIVDTGDVEAFRNNEKLNVRMIWEVTV